jgi:hypothetical protein
VLRTASKPRIKEKCNCKCDLLYNQCKCLHPQGARTPANAEPRAGLQRNGELTVARFAPRPPVRLCRAAHVRGATARTRRASGLARRGCELGTADAARALL